MQFQNNINNLLRKLTNSRRTAHPATLRTTALALCFSTAEFDVLRGAVPDIDWAR